MLIRDKSEYLYRLLAMFSINYCDKFRNISLPFVYVHILAEYILRTLFAYLQYGINKKQSIYLIKIVWCPVRFKKCVITKPLRRRVSLALLHWINSKIFYQSLSLWTAWMKLVVPLLMVTVKKSFALAKIRQQLKNVNNALSDIKKCEIIWSQLLFSLFRRF